MDAYLYFIIVGPILIISSILLYLFSERKRYDTSEKIRLELPPRLSVGRHSISTPPKIETPKVENSTVTNGTGMTYIAMHGKLYSFVCLFWIPLFPVKANYGRYIGATNFKSRSHVNRYSVGKEVKMRLIDVLSIYFFRWGILLCFIGLLVYLNN